VFGFKHDIVSFLVIFFFHAQKKILVFIKYFLEKKSSLNHHIMGKKKNAHPMSPTTPSPTIKKTIVEKPKKPIFLP
jgi:hypothetical protein